MEECFHRRNPRGRHSPALANLRAISRRRAGAKVLFAARDDGNRRRLFLAAGAAMFIFGITLAALGALFGMSEVRERIHVDLAQQGDIFLMLYFGVFLSTIIVGPIIDSFGNK